MIIEHTRSLLHNYQAQSPQEAANCQRILSLLNQENITQKLHFDPGHLTASAMVLSPDKQKILLIYHSAFQAWIQPGGHLDPTDRTPLEAAKRELSEECLLNDVAPLLDFPSLLQVDIHDVPPNPIKGQPAHQHYDLRFVFVSKTWSIEAASDAKAAEWVAFEDFDLSKSDASVAESVRRILAFLKA